MPLTVTSILSALVLTYLVSRGFLRLFPGSGPVRLVAAHGASLLLLAGLVGLLKAYFTSFAYQQAAVLVVPQLFWLGIDALRGLGDSSSRYGTSMRGSRPR